MKKTFEPTSVEQRLYAMWESEGCFAAGAAARQSESYCVMIPPPNVTGSLHMGHAFNNTLQDIMVRWHRMRGFDTLWQPGTDHAGIATQMVTEREMAAAGEPTRAEMGRDAFIARVWEQKAKSRGHIVGQLKRLGASCDWSREAFTMSGAPSAPDGEGGNFHDAVIRVFVEMHAKGLIYRGKRLVNWDPHFQTAISDVEVENIETPGHMWHFKYPLAGGARYEYVERDEDGHVTLREERDYISIATTRPETMLGDGAVAVHPSDERYRELVGKFCEIPVGPKEHRRLIPIIVDEYPDPDFGSGAVKITGAHDFNDYAVARRAGIPLYRLMDEKGAMRADGDAYARTSQIAQDVAQGKRTLSEAETDEINLVPDALRGLDRFEARARVVEQITAEGLAVMTTSDDPRLGGKAAPEEVSTVPLVEAKAIMQPFGDRSKVVIEPMLTDQWFVDAHKMVTPALDTVRKGDVKIVPESGRNVYFKWLENIEPWCISRQLWWGHQIPVWYDREGGEFCAENVAAAYALAAAQHNTDPWHQAAEQSARLGACPFEGDHPCKLTRDSDVLDTWFSSGLWPIGTLGWPEQSDELRRYFPTSDLITGQDILFFWVARMIMMQLCVVDEVPFRSVYLHGLVRDSKGRKMSKSLGNVVDPIELIDQYGADALRFASAAMASLGGTLKLDTQRIEGYRNFGTKLWNAHRFAEMNGALALNPGRPEPSEGVNRWIIGEVAKTRLAVDAALEDYRFNDAALVLYGFVWGSVCDWYVEFSKSLLNNERTADETRATLAWVLDQCLVLLHPIMPFITEELWSQGERPCRLIHAPWPEYGAELIDAEADVAVNWVISLIESIRSARAQLNVPAGAKVSLVHVAPDGEALPGALRDNMELVQRLARIEAITQGTEQPKGAVTLSVAGATFAMPLADLVDVEAEKQRLQKQMAKLDQDIKGLEGRANNPRFVQSAPKEVVEETKRTLEGKLGAKQTLSDALARLEELG